MEHKEYTQNIVPYHFMNEAAHLLYDKLQRTPITLPTYISISTRPWCNCREMGFVLRMTKASMPTINMAFYTHRNSDSMICLQWQGELPIDGSATCDDLPEGFFSDKHDYTKEWGPDNQHDVISYIEEQLKEYANKALLT